MIDGGGSSTCESCDVQRKDGKVGWREGGVDVEKGGKRKEAVQGGSGMMGVAHGGGKGRAVAAKSAHSAALLDRLWNINLQHYRPEEQPPFPIPV